MTIGTRSLPPPSRRTYAAFVLGWVAFTVYGSWVPFGFRARPWGEAVDSFFWALTNRASIESRSDGLANVLLGVPLGFGLLGLICLDRAGRDRAAGYAVLLLPVCVLFAAAVEFSQLFIPVRTCAGSDVICQGIGSAAGMLVWVFFGQRLTDEARVAWGIPGVSGQASRQLLAYLVLLGFVQELPLDLSLSPADLYRKFRDGQVRAVPFGEFGVLAGAAAWHRVATLLSLGALYLPAGLLAAYLPGRFWRAWGSWPRVFGLGLGLAVVLEAGQLFVRSRFTSATDAVVGALAVSLGWGLARAYRSQPSFWLPAVCGLAWLTVLAVVGWEPFDFRSPPGAMAWIPDLPREGKSDLFALEEMLTKMVLLVPIGVVVAARCARLPVVWGSGVAVLVAAGVEYGQRYLPTRFPGVTDVILGGIGGGLGAWAAVRVRAGDGVQLERGESARMGGTDR